jgi:hypothetical protein
MALFESSKLVFEIRSSISGATIRMRQRSVADAQQIVLRVEPRQPIVAPLVHARPDALGLVEGGQVDRDDASAYAGRNAVVRVVEVRPAVVAAMSFAVARRAVRAAIPRGA